MKYTNTFIIFATLLRRFDALHNKMNTMQLQASVAAIRGTMTIIIQITEETIYLI